MIGLLTCPIARAVGDEGALRLIREAGFDGVDYSMHTYTLGDPLYQLPKEALMARYAALRAVMDGLGLRACQLHAHYPTYAGDERDEQRFRAVVSGLWAAKALGSPYAVVHPAMLNAPADAEVRRATWALNRTFYTRLIPVLRECGVQLGVENMFLYKDGQYHPTPISTAADMVHYIDRMNDIAGEELFVACLDTGHAHLLGLDAAEMVHELGHRLKLLHLHDNLRDQDAHTAPYMGSLDWENILASLADIDYRGWLSFEAHGFLNAFPREAMPEAAALLAVIGRTFENRLGATKKTEERP